MKKIFKKMNKSFRSSIDKFLEQFDQTHTPSQSQKKEIDKHSQIAKMRDHAHTKKTASKHQWPED